MEKIVYIDKLGHEWRRGGTASRTVDKNDETTISLPFIVDAMHPVHDPDEYIYSTCVGCGQTVERGVLVLLLNGDGEWWGVRIGCHQCFTGIQYFTPHPIVDIFSILEPVINKACRTVPKACPVCLRPSRCTNPECLKMIKCGVLNTTLDHFMHTELDLLSPLIEYACGHCRKTTARRVCKTCRLLVFCDAKCKKLSGHKGCKSYLDIFK
jgi:hypothetical protein